MNIHPSSPDYHFGHEDLDGQHDHIVRLASALLEGHQTAEPETIELVLHHLLRFVEWHFATEESVMESGGYPLLETHRREHRWCLQRLGEFSAEHARTGIVDREGLVRFLCGWLERHTFRSDRIFHRYLQKQLAG